MARLGGLEPYPAYRVENGYSIQLSYRRFIFKLLLYPTELRTGIGGR